MYLLVISLILLFSVLLVLVILAQNSKGGGLTSQFGGSSASNIIGVKKTGDLLEKLTWGFIVGIMVLALSTNFIVTNQTGKPVTIRGAIFNNTNQLVDSFLTMYDGMGKFAMEPNAKETYYCNWIDEYGISHTSDLPIAKKNGVIIFVDGCRIKSHHVQFFHRSLPSNGEICCSPCFDSTIEWENASESQI